MPTFRTRWAERTRRLSGGLRRVFRNRWSRRVPKLAALVLLVGYALYLVVANALLRFGAVEWFVNSSTPDAHLTLGPCTTLVPGRIEVRDLRLRFQDQNVQFEVVVPRGRTTLDFFSLVKKRLHLRALDADGVRFHFRHKVIDVAGNEKRLRHFPHIEGFADPPVLHPGPPPDKSKSWAIFLENVRARGVELWFMEYRFAGHADVTGAFELVPGKRLWVHPAHADFVSGEVTIGEKRPFGRAVKGKLDFRFRETNPDPVPGLQIFRWISARASLDADLADITAANLYTAEGSRVSFAKGAGHLQARVELVDGRFVPESFVAYRGGEHVVVLFGDTTAHARLDTEARAQSRANAPVRLSTRASLRDLVIELGERRQSRLPNVEIATTDATLASDNADVVSPWKLDEASLRVRDGGTSDFGALVRTEGKRPVFSGGSAAFLADVTLMHAEVWSGSARVDVRGTRMSIGGQGTTLDAAFSLAAESPRRNLGDGTFRDVTLELRGRETSGKNRALRTTLKAARVDWSEFPPGAAHGRVTLSAPHIEPMLRAVGAPSLLTSVWPDEPFDASARIAVEPDGLDLFLDRAESGPFRARGRLRACSAPRAAFLVKSGVFSLGLLLRGGQMRVVPLASDAWLAKNVPSCPLEP